MDADNAVVTAICAKTGVSEAEFAVAKAARAKAAVTASAPRSGQFNLGQFSSAGATAIMAANAKSKFMPDAGRDDFSDDRSNSPRDDDKSEHSNLGMAADLINCEISGESGPGCGHNCDHVARATECLQNYSRDEAMRKRNLADAGRMHSVRFVA